MKEVKEVNAVERVLNNSNWIQLVSYMPKEYKIVQVTYLNYDDNMYYCDKLAYWNGDGWCWDNGDDVDAEIIAWRNIGDPFFPID